MPHRLCLLAAEGEWLVWATLAADALVWLEYIVFPLFFSLMVFGRSWVPVPIRRSLYWTAAFVWCCGWTHFMRAANLFSAYYKTELTVIAATAIVGVAAGFRIFQAVRSWRADVWIDAMRAGFAVLRDGSPGDR